MGSSSDHDTDQLNDDDELDESLVGLVANMRPKAKQAKPKGKNAPKERKTPVSKKINVGNLLQSSTCPCFSSSLLSPHSILPNVKGPPSPVPGTTRGSALRLLLQVRHFTSFSPSPSLPLYFFMFFATHTNLSSFQPTGKGRGWPVGPLPQVQMAR
jgi:hypothetical protein